MPKKIRFSELVKISGNPETAILWAKPKSSSPFMAAVRENRVLTVSQKPTGTKKDLGRVGFHQQPFASYLVFPKKLPIAGEADVIGIKYNLLQELKVSAADAFHPQKVKLTRSESPKKITLRKFSVTLLRIATMETKIEITADTLATAEAKALALVERKKFIPAHIQNEMKSIAELNK